MRVNFVLAEDNLAGGTRVIAMYAEHLRHRVIRSWLFPDRGYCLHFGTGSNRFSGVEVGRWLAPDPLTSTRSKSSTG